jgi:hypothetical protein
MMPKIPGTRMETDETLRIVENRFLGTSSIGVSKSTLAGLSIFDPRDYGVTFDNVTDDSTAWQACIDAASAAASAGVGRIVYVPPKQSICKNVVLKSGVTLMCFASVMGYQAGGNNRFAVLRNPDTAGWVLDTPSDGASQSGVIGVNFKGGGAGVNSGGLRLRGSMQGNFERLHFDNFANQGLCADSSTVFCVFRDIATTNCVLNSSGRSAVIGGVDILGTDHRVENVESVLSYNNAVSSASLYCVGARVGGSNHFVNHLIGSFGDVGIYVDATLTSFSGCRGDLSAAHGYLIANGSNQFSTCRAINNSRASTNTYSGFKADGVNNMFAACASMSTGSPTHKYGFEDTVAQAGVNRNSYVACTSSGHGTADFATSGYLPSAVLRPSMAIRPADGSTSVDVTGTDFVNFQAYSTNTTVTAFTGGVSGQELWIVGDANVTLENNSTIKTSSGSNRTLADNKLYCFKNWNGSWYEMAYG